MASETQDLEPRIRDILTAPDTDLATISAKRVRKQLLQDDPSLSQLLKEQKETVENLIAQIYEQVCEEHDGTNEADDDESGGTSSVAAKRKREDSTDGTPAPKKTKKAKASKKQKTDEEFARELQTEINGRGRSSRAGTSKAKPTKRRKKKSADTISDGEDGDGSTVVKKKRGGGGFKKEFLLSEPLAAVVQSEKLSRPQTVKQLWVYIREHNLQNPENRKEIVCDDRFRALFKCDRVDMFKMNKELSQHFYELPPAATE